MRKFQPVDLRADAPAGNGRAGDARPILAEDRRAHFIPLGKRALGVGIHDGYLPPLVGPCNGQMSRHGGLPRAAFLLCNCNDACYQTNLRKQLLRHNKQYLPSDKFNVDATQYIVNETRRNTTS